MIRGALLGLSLVLSGGLPPPPAQPPSVIARDSAASQLDVARVREFLLTARVIRTRGTPKGATSPRRVTLSDGTLEHDAVFQSIDQEKTIMRFESGRAEIGFRDSYHFNIAAFEIANLLGLAHMVPVTVERTLFGDRGSLSWWVDWRWDEQMRVKEKRRPPDPLRWRQQWDIARVFSALVDDTDRNQTNMLISEDWHVWMVDFSRAFRRSPELREPASLRYCSRALLARLRALDENAVREAVGNHLRPEEVKGLLARRDALLAHFDRLVSERGEQVVLFDGDGSE